MNKTELVNQISEHADISKDKAGLALNACLHMIQETLARGGQVSLPGFGAFTVKSRAARTGRNPATGAAIEIPAAQVPTFKPGKHLKDAVNQ